MDEFVELPGGGAGGANCPTPARSHSTSWYKPGSLKWQIQSWPSKKTTHADPATTRHPLPELED